MIGIYKDKDEKFLLCYVSYGRLDLKKLFKRRENRLLPKMHFGARGVLFSYDLEGCHVEQGELMKKGAPINILELWKDKP